MPCSSTKIDLFYELREIFYESSCLHSVQLYIMTYKLQYTDVGFNITTHYYYYFFFVLK